MLLLHAKKKEESCGLSLLHTAIIVLVLMDVWNTTRVISIPYSTPDLETIELEAVLAKPSSTRSP